MGTLRVDMNPGKFNPTPYQVLFGAKLSFVTPMAYVALEYRLAISNESSK